MATETLTEQPSAALKARLVVALEASWELESVADVLVDRAQGVDVQDLVLRTLTLRVRELSQLIMSAVDWDDDEPLANLRKRLTGMSSSADEEASHG